MFGVHILCVCTQLMNSTNNDSSGKFKLPSITVHAKKKTTAKDPTPRHSLPDNPEKLPPLTQTFQPTNIKKIFVEPSPEDKKSRLSPLSPRPTAQADFSPPPLSDVRQATPLVSTRHASESKSESYTDDWEPVESVMHSQHKTDSCFSDGNDIIGVSDVSEHSTYVGTAIAGYGMQAAPRLPSTCLSKTDIYNGLRNQINIGKTLGEGGFGEVKEISLVHPSLELTMPMAAKFFSDNTEKGQVSIRNEFDSLKML